MMTYKEYHFKQFNNKQKKQIEKLIADVQRFNDIIEERKERKRQLIDRNINKINNELNHLLTIKY